MRAFITFVFLACLATNSFYAAEGISCGVGRPACVTSCMVQNCATGYCDNGTCVCSRCDVGPSWR